MQWYYADNQQSIGPVEDEAFKTLVQDGKIKMDTLVWHEGMPQWDKYGTVVPNAALTTQVRSAVNLGTANCAQCGQSCRINQMVEFQGTRICADCKPKFFQRVQEGGELPSMMHYAGFWIRLCAKFIDGLILGVVNFLISMAMGVAGATVADSTSQPESLGAVMGVQGILIVVQIAIGVAFYVFFVGKFGATPGKMALRLRIVRASGERVSYGRACGRYFAEMLSAIILNIGYLMAAWDEEKRALHDRVCDTRVIRIG